MSADDDKFAELVDKELAEWAARETRRLRRDLARVLVIEVVVLVAWVIFVHYLGLR